VNDGRRHLNFSEWAGYDRSKALRKLHEIDEEVSSKAMPLSSYTFLHPEARLSEQERALVSEWAKAEGKRLELASAGNKIKDTSAMSGAVFKVRR